MTVHIKQNFCVYHHDHDGYLRWEKYAPGPVRHVDVQKDKVTKPRDKVAKAKAAPKGRKRKVDAMADIPIGQQPGHQQVFNGSVGGGGVVVPVATAGPPNDPLFQGPTEAEPPTPSPAQWPTRNTFAGRNKTGQVWDDRRSMFYNNVPCEFWKDSIERRYWQLCSSESSLRDAMTRLLGELSSPDCTAKPSHRSTAKAPAKKPSTKVKAIPKEPGKGRGRGRGRGRGAVKAK